MRFGRARGTSNRGVVLAPTTALPPRRVPPDTAPPEDRRLTRGKEESAVAHAVEMKASVSARLAAIARAPADSGWAAQSKVRALAALVELGEASPVGERRRLLEEVADSWPASAGGAQTRLAAIEVLERLDAPLRGSAPTPSPPLLLCQCGSKS